MKAIDVLEVGKIDWRKTNRRIEVKNAKNILHLQTRGEPSTWTPRGELVKAEASQILLGALRAQDVQSSPRTMKIILKTTEILEFSIATVQIMTI